MNLKDLKPNEKNPRKITGDALSRLEKSLKEFGSLDGFIYNKTTGRLISGHQRQKILGEAEIVGDHVIWNGQKFPYREVEWSELKEKSANIQANNLAGTWDEDILEEWMKELKDADWDLDLTGFDEDSSERKVDGKCDEDEVPEPTTATNIKLGDLFILGNHRLLCGDSTDSAMVARLMNGEKADMVFTDPPYGNVKLLADNKIYRFSEGQNNVAKGKKYHKYGNEGDFQFPNFFEAVKDIAPHLVIWGGNCFANDLPMSTCWLVWDKCASEENGGNWFSDCELAWTNLKMPIVKVRHVLQGMITESKEERVHPTQKPVDFIVKCFNRLEQSHKGNFASKFIVDLFLGSGSTLIACEKTNRKCFGMEIDPQYCGVILDRWCKFTGKDPIREDGKSWSEIKAS